MIGQEKGGVAVGLSSCPPPPRLIYDRNPRFSRGGETNELCSPPWKKKARKEGMQIGGESRPEKGGGKGDEMD